MIYSIKVNSQGWADYKVQSEQLDHSEMIFYINVFGKSMEWLKTPHWDGILIYAKTFVKHRCKLDVHSVTLTHSVYSATSAYTNTGQNATDLLHLLSLCGERDDRRLL